MHQNKKSYFKLFPHGPLEEVLPNIYTVTGSMRLFGLFQYSRVMTIFLRNGSLAIMNPVRVEEDVLAAILRLGKIDYLLKIGQLHNVDVPYYMDKFSPELWVNRDDPSVASSYPAKYFDDVDEIPGLGLRVKTIAGSKIKEAVIFSPEDGGCLHSCDAFVNMGVDPYHNWLTAKLSRFLPDPTYLGPNWLKIAKPPRESLVSCLDNDFEHFIPAHGKPILGGAKGKLVDYLASKK